MMKTEFEALTGVYLTESHYNAVEAVYAVDTQYASKQEFCEAYRENRDGMAERIAHAATMNEIAQEHAVAEKIQQAAMQADELKAKVERLERDLEREQEWKPYVMEQNVPSADYEQLAKSGRIMTDEEAVQLVADEFGFQPDKIRIIHQVETWEINRHRMLRKVGEEERLPRYCATDWNYVRFDVACWHYEMSNGTLRQYYC